MTTWLHCAECNEMFEVSNAVADAMHHWRKESGDRICTYFSCRSSGAIHNIAWKITRYWLSAEQMAERERDRCRFLHLPAIFEGETT